MAAAFMTPTHCATLFSLYRCFFRTSHHRQHRALLPERMSVASSSSSALALALCLGALATDSINRQCVSRQDSIVHTVSSFLPPFLCSSAAQVCEHLSSFISSSSAFWSRKSMNAHCCLLAAAAAAAVEYSLRDTPKVQDVRDELGVCVCVV